MVCNIRCSNPSLSLSMFSLVIASEAKQPALFYFTLINDQFFNYYFIISFDDNEITAPRMR